MILRRLTEHVKAQNWFAVGIDFLIVVVGVFVGLQVSNWNTARLQEKTAQIYIERIREDLAGNREDLGQRLAYFRHVRASALDVLAALDQSPETLGEQFLIDIYTASHILPRELGRDTYDEILSVGANNAISDVAVRKRLANFYRSIKAQITTLKLTTPYRVVIRRNLAYTAHVAIGAACGDKVATGATGEPIIILPTECEPGLTPDEISQAISEILMLNIRKDLVRRITDLDAKLVSIQLILDRASLLDEYLEDVQK